MNIIECIVVGISSLRRHPLRSSLTILGIVVGVGSVVGMVSVGDGSRAMVLREIERTGGVNMIEIFRDDWDKQSGTLTRAAGKTVRSRRWKRNRAEHLETSDAFAILDSVKGVAHVIAEDDMGGWNVNYQGISKDSRIVASTAGYDQSHNWYPQIGRFFTEEEVEAASNVAVIGSKIYEEVFKGEDPIGEEIKATRTSSWGPRYDVRLTVIGVMQEKGDAMDTQGWDDRFIIPITTLQQRFKGRKDVERIRVEADSQDKVALVIEESKRILGRRHHNSGEEYQYWTATEELATAEKIGRTMKFLLGGIAGIALVVAGIGVMNIMLVSVTERTKEIGLRKALGAKRRDILLQFLIEAGTLTLFGGILGAILGVFMGQGTAALIETYVWPGSNWPSIISLETIILAMTVSMSVGIFFGLYPANRAAQLTPVEALRELPETKIIEIAGQKFQFASLSDRLWGHLLDDLIYTTIILVPWGLMVFFGLENSTSVLLISALFALLYLFFQDGLKNGQSFGKWVVKTRVIDSRSGLACKLSQSFLRNLSLPILSLVDWFFILGEKRQRLGDKTANTFVVKAI